MLRPQWIAALVLALAVAALFAWLGRWQLGSALLHEDDVAVSTEQLRPLSEVAQPGEPINGQAAGTLVSVAGTIVPGDDVVVSQRASGDGRTGYWLVSHLVTGSGSERANLAVAVGWADSREQAESAGERLSEQLRQLAQGGSGIHITGRYMPMEEAKVPQTGQQPLEVLSMVPAQVANLWHETSGKVYSGYLVLRTGTGDGATAAEKGSDGASLLAAAGLASIPSPAPEAPEKINWLNMFYAIEWVVFAGFALFFWFRLTRDAWEKEHELQLLAREQAVGAADDAAGGSGGTEDGGHLGRGAA